MLPTDLVAELRAEVTRWWEMTCKHRREQEASQTSQLSAPSSSSSSSVITPILGAMLVEGPMRMITLGQELSVDVDEKTLAEMQFKDSQVCVCAFFRATKSGSRDKSVASQRWSDSKK